MISLVVIFTQLKSQTKHVRVHNQTNKTKYVIIGDQVWTTENLNVDTFRNGDKIPQAKSFGEWNSAGALREPVWCYYNNDPTNGVKYGKLYNWYAVNDPRGLAPEGWHIPSAYEWDILGEKLNVEVVAGKKMKSTHGWASYNGESGNGTNSSGFSALPSGERKSNGEFKDLGEWGNWWTSTEENNDKARHRRLSYLYGNIDRSFVEKDYGFSVRCIRD